MIRRSLAALVALILLLCAMPAFADTEIMYVTENSVQVYYSPSYSAKKYTTLSFGEEVVVNARNNSWAQLTNDEGALGYCRVSGLSAKNPNVDPVEFYVKHSTANIYEKTSTSAEVLETRSYGDSVRAVAITPDKEWLRVESGDFYGYIKCSALMKDAPQGSNTQGKTAQVYIRSTTAALRASASGSASKTGTAYFGEGYTLTKLSGDWGYITGGGISGWCKKSALSLEKQTGAAQTYYVTKDDTGIYARSGGSLRIAETLDKGDTVSVVAFTPDGGFAMATYDGGHYGYIRRADISHEAPKDDAPEKTAVVYIKSTMADLRASASGSAAKTGVVYFGEEYTLSKLSGDWGYITGGGISGWCKKSALSLEKQTGAAQTYYVTEDGSGIYTRSGDSLKSAATVNAGDAVSVVAFTPDGGFAMVAHKDGYGYMYRSVLSGQKPEAEPEPITAYVVATNADVHKSDSDSAKKTGVVSFGEKLTCTKVKGSWAFVKASGVEGWVRKSALSTDDPLGEAKTYYVKDTGAKVFARPTSSADSPGKLAAGASVEVLGTTRDNAWHVISYKGGIAYVSASALTVTAPEKPITVYVRYDIVTAYKSSSSSSGRVGEVCYGEELSRLRTSGDWALVRNSAGQGWVKKDALTTTDPNGEGVTFYAAEEDAVIYKKPAATATKLVKLYKDEAVTVIATLPDGHWVRVKRDGGYGYMKTSSLTSVKPDDSGYSDPYKGTANSTIERICAIAVAQYGKPYVYAEEGPDSYDCSGLLWYAYSKGAGIYLKRTGHEQGYDDRYPRIESISELKRGDVLVFNTIEDGDDDLSDHTGLYLGGGLFIHASSGADKVIVSDVTGGYYNRKFSWALRVIN